MEEYGKILVFVMPIFLLLIAIEKIYGTESAIEGARTLAEKQRARLEKLEPQVAKRRLMGMLARRGYGHEEIEQVVREMIRGR